MREGKECRKEVKRKEVEKWMREGIKERGGRARERERELTMHTLTNFKGKGHNIHSMGTGSSLPQTKPRFYSWNAKTTSIVEQLLVYK